MGINREIMNGVAAAALAAFVGYILLFVTGGIFLPWYLLATFVGFGLGSIAGSSTRSWDDGLVAGVAGGGFALLTVFGALGTGSIEGFSLAKAVAAIVLTVTAAAGGGAISGWQRARR